MFASVRLALVLGPLVLVAGCSSHRPPLPRAPSSTSESTDERTNVPVARGSDADERGPDPLPKVVRRILSEEKDLVARSQAMASELPDPRGRARAMAEVDELAQQLARIAEGVARAADGRADMDSDALDTLVNELLLLDTRVALLHEKLRTATERTTAVLVE